MSRRLLLAALLALFTLRANALEYTDVYFNPQEPGWGVFLIQSDKTQFIAFFIYGADGKPLWYSALLTEDGTGKYTGPLYLTSGTYFANPWNGYSINPAGTVAFAPSDRYHATLTYSVTGVGTVTKSIERETLTPYVLAGNYSGSMSGEVNGCADPARNESAFRGRYALAVTQAGDQSAVLVFTFVDANHSGIVCTVSGPLNHLGRLYQMNGSITCEGPGQGGGNHAVTIDGLHPTGQGLEGYLTGQVGGACNVSLHFAGVLNVNN
jgi:hypothetical protein